MASPEPVPEPEYLEIKFLLEGVVEECPVVTAVLVLPVLPVLRPEVYFTHVLGLLPTNVSLSNTKFSIETNGSPTPLTAKNKTKMKIFPRI